MKVAIVTSHPIQYQAPWFRELARNLDLKVWFAYNPSPEQQGKEFGVPFVWDVDLLSGYSYEFLENIAPKPGTGHFRGCDTPEIGRHLEEGGYDAVILCGWHLKCYIQAWWACRKLNMPILVRGDSQLGTPRSWWKRLVKQPLYRWFLAQFDGFLSVGQRNREYLQNYGVHDKKIFFAPHFVDTNFFADLVKLETSAIQNLRRSWYPADLIVGFVGKLEKKKRPFDVLFSCSLITEKSVLPIFVGAGDLDEELKKLAVSLKVPALFYGFKNQTELPIYYAAMDVIVLPSSGGETWGLVVNEAMACGTPAIVSDACGCASDLIEHGKSGFTFPVGNIEELKNCLEEYLEIPNAKERWRAALSEKLNLYSVKECVKGTLAALNSVIK